MHPAPGNAQGVPVTPAAKFRSTACYPFCLPPHPLHPYAPTGRATIPPIIQSPFGLPPAGTIEPAQRWQCGLPGGIRRRVTTCQGEGRPHGPPTESDPAVGPVATVTHRPVRPSTCCCSVIRNWDGWGRVWGVQIREGSLSRNTHTQSEEGDLWLAATGSPQTHKDPPSPPLRCACHFHRHVDHFPESVLALGKRGGGVK